MQCVILAGGLATRLRPTTTSLPKALVPVGGRPYADTQLEWLAREGVSDVVYCIGHLGEQIVEHVGDGRHHGLRVSYIDEGPELRGTAGALRLAYDESALQSRFGVLYADSFLSVTLRDVEAEMTARKPAAVMTVYRNNGRFGASNVQLSGGFVVRYDKTAADPVAEGLHWIDYGFSMIDRDAVMPDVPAGQVVDLAAVQAALSAQGRLAGYAVSERFYEIGSPAGLAELEAHLAEHPHTA